MLHPYVGNLKPRLRVVPAYELTYGPAACDLYEMTGQKLDSWQRDAIHDCMAVFPDTKKWVCKEYAEFCPRQNGKGIIPEARVLAALFLVGEEYITWSAHLYKTATKAFIRLRKLLKALEENGKIPRGSMRITSGRGDEMIELRETGQVVEFIARTGKSGRGFTGDLSVIDETFGYSTDEQAALVPTLSARPNSQLIYTSTPPLNGETGEVMFSLQARALMGNDPRLGYRDWGASGTLEEVLRPESKFYLDLDSKELWAKHNPAYGVRITDDAIEVERRSMTAVDFARERFGVWPKQMVGGGAIDFDKWAALINDQSVRTGDCAIGIDIAPDRSCFAIAIYGSGLTIADGDVVGHLQLVDYDFGTKGIVDRLIELDTVLKPVSIAMGKGTFTGLETDLANAGLAVSEDSDHPKRGDLLVMNGWEMAAACGHLLDAVRDRTMRVKPDPTAPEVLERAVKGAQLRQSSDTVTWSRKEGASDITPLQAATMARYGFISRVNAITEEIPTFFGTWR